MSANNDDKTLHEHLVDCAKFRGKINATLEHLTKVVDELKDEQTRLWQAHDEKIARLIRGALITISVVVGLIELTLFLYRG